MYIDPKPDHERGGKTECEEKRETFPVIFWACVCEKERKKYVCVWVLSRVLSMMAWMTLGPIMLEARLERPKRPKNWTSKVCERIWEGSGDLPCCQTRGVSVLPKKKGGVVST